MTAPGGRQVKIVISADVAQAIRAMGQVEQGLGGVSQGADRAGKQTSRMGDVMKGTLAATGITAGLTGIVDGLKSVVNGGLGYERSMNTMGAVTGASATEMRQIADTAKQLGSDIKIPGASAQTAAAAMTELAKGGLTAQEAMDASRGTMILAAAASIEGAQAAEIQANALQTFGLKADQAGRVANVLANVANKSSGEITDFSQALAQSGAVANMMGLTIEDTATALGLFANAGLKGSDAGTSLKTSLTALLNPSKESQQAIDKLGLTVQDSQGNFVGYRSIVEQLTEAKGRMTQMEFNAAAAQVLGTDAVRAGAIVAAGGTAAWDEMAGALSNVNGAQDVAAANSKGLTGVIDALKNTVDTASLSLFETLQPSIMQVAEAATGLVGPLAEGLAPALGAVADLATGSLAPAIDGIAGLLGAVAGPLSGVIGWFSELPGPVGAGVLALGGVIALRGPLLGTFATASASLSTLLATLRGTAGAAAAGSAGLAGWIASVRAASGAAATFGVVAKGALSVLGGPIGLAIIGAATALSFFSSTTDDASGTQSEFAGALDRTTGALNDQAAQAISAKVASSGLGEMYKGMGGDVADLVDAIGGVPGKQEIVNQVITDAKNAALEAGGAYTSMGAAVAAGGGDIAAFGSEVNAAAQGTEGLSAEFQAAQGAGQLFTQLLGEFAGAQGVAKVEAEGLQGELGKVGEGAKGAAAGLATAEQAATPFTESLKGLRAAASEADNAAQFLYLTLIEMAGGQVTAEQATRANEAAFREIAGSARDYAEAQQKVADKEAELTELSNHLGVEYKGQIVTQADLDRVSRELADAKNAVADADDRQFEAGTKAAQSASDMAAAAYSAKAAQGDMAGAVAAATQVMEGQRQKFIESQIEAGKTSEEAVELADKYGLIPANVTTIINAQGIESAIERAAELNRQLKTVDGMVVKYTVIGDTVYQSHAGSIPSSAIAATKAQGGWIGLAAGGLSDGMSGWVHGPGGPTDDLVVAEGPGGEQVRVSADEFVVKASEARKVPGLLEDINSGAFAASIGRASGGWIGLAGGGSVAGGKAVGTAFGATLTGQVSAPDPAAVEGPWKLIAGAVTDAWEQEIRPALDDLQEGSEDVGIGYRRLLDDQVSPVWSGIQQAIADSSQQVGDRQSWLQGAVATAWQMMQNAQTASLTASQAAAYVPMADWSVRLGDAQTALAKTTDTQWSGISGSITDAQTQRITPAFDTINTESAGVGDKFSALAGTTSSQWSAIGSTIDGAKSGTIIPAIDAIGQAAGGLETAFGSAAQGISTKWSEIKPGVADPVNWLLGSVWNQGLVGAWAKIKGWLPSISTELGPLDLVGYATGGPVHGPGTDTSDNILARLSPGEWVVPADATRKNIDLLKQITPGFATGGPVGGWSSIPSLSSALGGSDQPLPEDMVAFVKAFVANPFDTITDLIGEPLVRASQYDAGFGQAMTGATGEMVGGMISTLKDMFGLENDGKGGPPKLDGSGTLTMDGVLFVDGEAYALPSGTRGEFLKAVASKMGTSYSWGAAGPDVFDCSGLMSWALEQAGAGVGRQTAQGFHAGFPHVGMPGKPGDLATYSARYSKASGMAGHIGAILDVGKGLMMHTDGAGPARVGDYRGREGGPLSIVDVIGGSVGEMSEIGELPALIRRVIYGDYSTAAGVGAIDPKDAANMASWDSTRTLDTLNPIQDHGPKNMARGTMDMVGPLPPGDAVNRWAPLAASAFDAKGLSTENVPNLLRQLRVESGGNPLAYNDYDRNYHAGHPSKSLLQTIPSTFANHAAAGYNTNIWHPPSNFLSAIDYAWGKYGSFPGRAYENGGVLPPGFTMAFNGTGKDEYVYTQPQGGVQIDYKALAAAVGQQGLAPADIANAMSGMTFQMENGGESIRMIARQAALSVAGQQARVNRINGGR